MSGDTNWHFTDAALIRVNGERVTLYGRWDRHFGCWERTPDGLVARVPLERLFDRLGRWRDPEGLCTAGWYQARAARAAYFSIIPTQIRRMIGQGSERHWLALQTAWDEANRQGSAKIWEAA